MSAAGKIVEAYDGSSESDTQAKEVITIADYSAKAKEATKPFKETIVPGYDSCSDSETEVVPKVVIGEYSEKAKEAIKKVKATEKVRKAHERRRLQEERAREKVLEEKKKKLRKLEKKRQKALKMIAEADAEKLQIKEAEERAEREAKEAEERRIAEEKAELERQEAEEKAALERKEQEERQRQQNFAKRWTSRVDRASERTPPKQVDVVEIDDDSEDDVGLNPDDIDIDILDLTEEFGLGIDLDGAGDKDVNDGEKDDGEKDDGEGESEDESVAATPPPVPEPAPAPPIELTPEQKERREGKKQLDIIFGSIQKKILLESPMKFKKQKKKAGVGAIADKTKPAVAQSSVAAPVNRILETPSGLGVLAPPPPVDIPKNVRWGVKPQKKKTDNAVKSVPDAHPRRVRFGSSSLPKRTGKTFAVPAARTPKPKPKPRRRRVPLDQQIERLKKKNLCDDEVMETFNRLRTLEEEEKKLRDELAAKLDTKFGTQLIHFFKIIFS